MDLTIQIVNFRSRHYLEECLFSIAENLPINIKAEVIVINNDIENLEKMRILFLEKINITNLEINQNVGFGKAHNIGARKARGKYIFFLNPDAKVFPGTIEKMTKKIGENENLAVVAPLLIDSGGRIDPDCFGFARTPLSIIFGKFFHQKKKKAIRKDSFEADWVSGGAMLIKRDIFEKLDGFDESFFMYFEDVDFCRRVKAAGHKVMIQPSARVFHESGKSFASEREKKRCYYASQDYYVQKHFGKSSAWLIKILRLPYSLKNIYFRQ